MSNDKEIVLKLKNVHVNSIDPTLYYDSYLMGIINKPSIDLGVDGNIEGLENTRISVRIQSNDNSMVDTVRKLLTDIKENDNSVSIVRLKPLSLDISFKVASK